MGQGRPDNFLCVSYFHCSPGYLFFPPCPVRVVGSIFACIFGGSIPLLINTPFTSLYCFLLKKDECIHMYNNVQNSLPMVW